MTLKEVIDRVDDFKPNAFAPAQKTAWINEIEGKAQSEVLLFAPPQIILYDWEKDQNTELLVAPPHDCIYPSYLTAMIDFANGEYGKYNNSYVMFNTQYKEFMRWFAQHYRPADAREAFI